METTFIVYCGRRLEVPIMPNGSPLHMPYDKWEWEKSYCGVGKGIGNWIVPEIFPSGTTVTPCCYIHDVGTELAENPKDYAINDRMFIRNMIEAVFFHHPIDIIGKKEHIDLLWAVSYYAAVDAVKS